MKQTFGNDTPNPNYPTKAPNPNDSGGGRGNKKKGSSVERAKMVV